MPINLLTAPWMPARRLSGELIYARPADLAPDSTDNPIIALAFPRPDWNAAVAEFLIGLLACAMAPEDTGQWAEVWNAPPTPDELQQRLAPFAFAFNLGGDGARCFQDHDPLADSEGKPISALLIDAPGANALTKNTDLFVKRAEDLALCPAFAAAALITMQTYAPAGGQGNRTSMRGGGPLTTLPLPRRRLGDAAVTILWDILWASVPDRDEAAAPPSAAQHPGRQDPGRQDPAWAKVFPWLAPARTSEKDRATQPEHGHPLQCFFATPRRIRLEFTPASGARCGLGGENSAVLVRSFRQKNYGVMYNGWLHPLSPYRVDKKAGKFAYHPQPGGATYRDWMTWLATPSDKTSERAAAVSAWDERLPWIQPVETGPEHWQSGLLACGFDMDNMKARSWLEARIPYFYPPPDVAPGRRAAWSSDFIASARRLVAGADEAAGALRYGARLARFGSCDREKGSYSLPKHSPGASAFEDLYETYWRETEADFCNILIRLSADPADESMALREDFLRALRGKALGLFDDVAGTDDLADQDARRVVYARTWLVRAFGAAGAVRKELGIVTAQAQQKAASRRKAK